MAESLRDYLVRFLYKTDDAGAKRAQSQLDNMRRALEKLGAASFVLNEITGAVSGLLSPFRGVAEMINRTAREGDDLQDLADRTGIATDKLEQFAYMAKLAGSSSETFVKSMGVLEKNMGEAANGSAAQAEMFAKLGISLRGANGKLKTTDEILPDISRALEKLPSHAQKTAYAMELFGKSGAEMLNFLAYGPERIAGIRRELELIGGITSQDFLDAASEYADNVDRLTQAWKGVRQAISGPIIMAINKVAAAFLQWWKVNGELTRSRFSEWAAQVAVSLSALWDMLRRIGGVLLLVAAALNIPLLAMVGLHLAIWLLIDDFAAFLKGNDSLIGHVINNWEAWLQKLGETHPVLAKVLEFFGGFVQSAAKGIEAMFYMFDVLLTEWAEKGWGGFLDELVLALKNTGEVMGAVWSSLWEFLTAPVVDTWENIKKVIFDTMLSAKGAASALGLDSLAQSIGSAAASFISGTASSDARTNKNTNVIDLNGAPTMMGGQPVYTGQGPMTNVIDLNAPVNVQIQAAPGMDEKLLAELVGKKISDHWDSEVRTGFNQAVPEFY